MCVLHNLISSWWIRLDSYLRICPLIVTSQWRVRHMLSPSHKMDENCNLISDTSQVIYDRPAPRVTMFVTEADRQRRTRVIGLFNTALLNVTPHVVRILRRRSACSPSLSKRRQIEAWNNDGIHTTAANITTETQGAACKTGSMPTKPIVSEQPPLSAQASAGS